MIFPPEGFEDFLKPDCDRKQFIIDRLATHGIKSSIVKIENSNHIFVHFPSSAYNPQFKIKTVLVHYDRVENSPGANDNSAAIFQIMDWAIRLSKRNDVHNIRIFFTDGEEMGASGGVQEQGAFGIASKFRKLGILQNDVYVFDCCGRGTIPIISQAGIGIGNHTFQKQILSLISRTENLVRSVSSQNWLSLPIPYSDNAGFLACGIPAVAITLLPQEEATQYLKELHTNPSLAEAIMGHKNPKTKLSPCEIQKKLPITWRLLHTKYDSVNSLTPEAFVLMERLLDTLANTKYLS